MVCVIPLTPNDSVPVLFLKLCHSVVDFPHEELVSSVDYRLIDDLLTDSRMCKSVFVELTLIFSVICAVLTFPVASFKRVRLKKRVFCVKIFCTVEVEILQGQAVFVRLDLIDGNTEIPVRRQMCAPDLCVTRSYRACEKIEVRYRLDGYSVDARIRLVNAEK